MSEIDDFEKNVLNFTENEFKAYLDLTDLFFDIKTLILSSALALSKATPESVKASRIAINYAFALLSGKSLTEEEVKKLEEEINEMIEKKLQGKLKEEEEIEMTYKQLKLLGYYKSHRMLYVPVSLTQDIIEKMVKELDINSPNGLDTAEKEPI